MALICEAAGADVYRVRDLLNKSPGRIMLMPGAGVGGACIPKDPWLLVGGAGSDGLARLVPAARAVNDGMPGHVLDLLAGALAEAGSELDGASVAVLGYAYLENSDDTRNSPSSRLVELLDLAGAAAVVHDPYVDPYAQAGGWVEAVRGCEAAVVMVAHDAYREIPLAALKELLSTPVLVDGRHVFCGKEADRAGLIYRCVGVGRPDSGNCTSR
jgi:UDP-N-acetyl-D-mannosaminuronic acid dehydrogenase